MNYDVKKYESKLTQLLSDIIFNELRGDISKITTISEVIVTKDKLTANVYLNFISGNPLSNLKKINNAKGFIRTQLSRNLNKRKAPELNFYLYDKLDKINKIESILEDINKKEK